MTSVPRKMAARQKIVVISISVALALAVLLMTYARFSGADTGDRIRDEGLIPGALDTVSVMLHAYETLIQLILTAFGAVAFFLVYQRERGLELKDDCWVYLAASLFSLGGALLFAVGCYETLLVMVGRNSVDVSVLALRFGRWIMYLLVLIAMVFLGLFAVEATLPKRQR